jgi:hypothetical protein
MNHSTRCFQKTHPDAYPTPIVSAQDGLPFGQDAADVQAGPNVQANGQAHSNGQRDGLPAPGADVAKPPTDPFDLDSLRLSQDFASAVGVKKLLKTVPVKRPSKEWFVRTHSDPSYRLSTAVLELKEDRETYLVPQHLWPLLADEKTFSPRLLVTAINRQNELFIWPIRLPGSNGKFDDWSRSAMDAAEEAKSRWVRVTASMSLGAYQVDAATGKLPDPAWPDVTFQEIIKIAFRDKMIDHWDHPVLKRLRGEV